MKDTTKDNLGLGLGIGVVVGLGILSAYMSAKAETDLKCYKVVKINNSGIDKLIIESSMSNDNFTDATSKYQAKKVLEFYRDDAMNAKTMMEVDIAISELKRVSYRFKDSNATYANVALMEEYDKMEAKITEKIRKDEEKARREMMNNQRKNTEAIINALNEKK